MASLGAVDTRSKGGRRCEQITTIPKNPQLAGLSRMGAQKRCERYVRGAMDLAENARGLAEYHTAQAKALSGR